MKNLKSKNIIIPTPAEAIAVIGEVVHMVNGKVVYENRNAINNNLKEYLRDSMDSNTDQAINSLIDAEEVNPGGAQDGNDGIVVHDSDASEWLTMTTTSIAANNTYGKRFEGDISSLSQSRTMDQSALGYDLGAGATHFGTVYATQTFTGIPLNSSAQYTIEWEIYIQ